LSKIEEEWEWERANEGQWVTVPEEQGVGREAQPLGGEVDKEDEVVDEEQAEEGGVGEEEWTDDQD